MPHDILGVFSNEAYQHFHARLGGFVAPKLIVELRVIKIIAIIRVLTFYTPRTFVPMVKQYFGPVSAEITPYVTK